MPKRPTKRETKRPAPYDLRAPALRQTSSSMAAALVSPIQQWTPQHHPSIWDPHMGYYPHQTHQPMMPNHMSISAPLPPQPVQAPSQPGQSAPWTSAEDSALIDAKGQGLGWNEIHQRFFPTKSGNACRKRHERLMVKIRTTEWSDVRIQNVMNAYNMPGVREQFWCRIAEPFGERWEDVEKVVCEQQSQSKHNLTKAVLPTRPQGAEDCCQCFASTRTLTSKFWSWRDKRL